MPDKETLSSHDKAATDSLLRVFLDNTGESYIFLDAGLKVIYCNEVARERTSFFFEERPVEGRLATDLVYGQKKQQFVRICNDVLQGETVNKKVQLLSGGVEKWIEKTFCPARSPKGKIIGIVITSKDITETYRKEQLLRVSNERYELITRATSDAIWDYDVASHEVYFNESFTRYFGHSIPRENDAYELWARHIHPDDKERVLAKLDATINGKATFWDDEYRFMMVDGNIAYVYDRGVILRNEQGDAVRIIGSMQDVSRQKENEIKVAQSEHRFRSLVQSGADLIGIVDPMGTYTYVSPTVTQLGYDVDYLVGKNAFDFIHPDDLDRVSEWFSALFNQKQASLSPFRFRDGNGQWRRIETVATNLLSDPVIKGIVINSRDVTEQKRKDEALQKAVNDLHKILDSSVDVIVVTDEGNRYVQVSAAAETVWGYKPEELIGRVCLELVHPDDVQHTNKATERVMKGARITNFQNRYLRKDGTVVPLIWSAKWDAKERVMYAIARDASEKLEAENALIESERRYRDLFYNNPLPMFAYDINNYEIVMVNEAVEEHTGYSRSELLSRSVVDMSVDEEIEKLKKFFATVNRFDRLRKAGEWKIKRKDGSVIEAEIISHSINYDARQCRLVVIHDLTEKNKAKADLQKSEAMFRAISESFPNGVVAILNKDLEFLYMAGKELETVGITASYFEGTLYNRHFPDDDLMISAGAEKVFRGETVVSELKFMGRNYMVSSVPLYETDGSVERILVVAQNITAQKRTQKEKELLISELTKNIHDLRQFSYITSHNLRAPISNLIGIMSLIDMKTITDPDTAFLVGKFKESTYLLNDTVTDLLNILLIKNNVNVKKEVFSLKQVWEDVCTSVSSQVRNADAEIRADFRYDEIEFNKSYAESILLNLLTNSLKYRDSNRQLVIELSTSRNSEYTILEFCDNGIGINLEHHREKIFGLYQRFHNYPDSKGLGLYIVHSQITALGGKIEVESEADKGTCFKVYFKR